MFQSNERWAIIKRGISALYLKSRCLEEFHILQSEVEQYFEWLVSQLDPVKNLLERIVVGSAIGNRALHMSVKIANALQNLHDIENIELTSINKEFETMTNKLKCI